MVSYGYLFMAIPPARYNPHADSFNSCIQQLGDRLYILHHSAFYFVLINLKDAIVYAHINQGLIRRQRTYRLYIEQLKHCNRRKEPCCRTN